MRKPFAAVILSAIVSGAAFGRADDSMPADVFVDWSSHNSAGWMAFHRGKLDVAEREFGRAIAKARPYAENDPRLLARSYNDLALILYRQGRAEEALPLAEWALSVREARIGPSSEPAAQTLAILAMIESELGRPDLAEARLAKVLKIHETRSGRSSLRAAEVLVDLAGVQIARRKFAQARASLGRVLAMPAEAVPPEDRSRALAHLGLADVDEAVGDVEAAVEHLQRALAVSSNDPSADPDFVRDLKARLEALRRRREPSEPEKSGRPENVVAFAAFEKEAGPKSRTIAARVGETGQSRGSESVSSRQKAAARVRRGDGGRPVSPSPRRTVIHPLGPHAMASRQTAQAGAFTAPATWVGGIVPTSGDTLTIGHAITWTPAADTAFTLGTGTGVAVAFGSAGSLTLTPAGPFVLTIAGSTSGGNVTTSEFVASSPNGPLTINLDATANTAGFAMIVGGTYSATNKGGWSLAGNSTYGITVASLPADGTKNSCFTSGGQYGGGVVNAAYTTFRRIGVASTTPAFAPALDNRIRSVAWSNVLLDACGEVTLSGDATYTGSVAMTDVTSVNTATNGTSRFPLNASFGAAGARTFTRCVWDKTIKFGHMRGCSFSACYFHNGWSGADVNSTWVGMDGCFVRQTFDSLITSGSVTNSFLYWDNPAGNNPHFLGGTSNPTGAVTFNWNGNVAYYNGTDAAGNVFLPPATSNGSVAYNINGNLILPNRAGTNSGALVTSNGVVAGGFSITANHNTVFVAGQHGFEIGHLYTSVETPNRYASVKSNLFIGGGTGYKAFNVDNTTIADFMPPANVDYNGSYQIKAASGNPGYVNEGKGYASRWSVMPGARDVDDQDPAFVDPTASLATWAVSRGSTAGTTLAQEADALNYLRADPTLAASLNSWIQSRFAPTNPAFKNAAHDGGDIGAVPVRIQSVVPRPMVRSMVGTELFGVVF